VKFSNVDACAEPRHRHTGPLAARTGDHRGAVINGVVAVPLMVVIMLMAMRREVMGAFTLPRPLWAMGWLCTAAMAAAVADCFLPGDCSSVGGTAHGVSPPLAAASPVITA
jgi:hypothetical protein